MFTNIDDSRPCRRSFLKRIFCVEDESPEWLRGEPWRGTGQRSPCQDERIHQFDVRRRWKRMTAKLWFKLILDPGCFRRSWLTGQQQKSPSGHQFERAVGRFLTIGSVRKTGGGESPELRSKQFQCLRVACSCRGDDFDRK